MAERKLVATFDDMGAMLPGYVCLEEDQDYFYAESMLFDDPSLHFRWDKEMSLDEPAKFHSPFDVDLDFDHVLRQQLSSLVALDHCVLCAQFGRLLDIRHHGNLVMQMTKPDVATHLILHIHWPVGQPPAYDANLDGDFARAYRAVAFARTEPSSGIITDDSGSDTWLLELWTLGETYRQSAANYAEIKRKIMECSWDEFELSKAFYRRQLATFEPLLQSIDLKVNYHEDFATLSFAENVDARSRRRFASLTAERIWYNAEYVGQIRQYAAEIQEVTSIISFVFGS